MATATQAQQQDQPQAPFKNAEFMQGVKVHPGGEPAYAVDLKKPIVDAESNDVLIKVVAASVNPVDWKVARGDFTLFVSVPEIPGYDVAGKVVACGNKVVHLKSGDSVWADIAPRSGTYAEYVLADSTNVDTKPENLSFNEAAAIPLAGLTAYQGLVHYGKIKPGDNVLILGGASGVGHFAIQIAKFYKATVWATASGEHYELLKKVGADYPINYQTEKLLDRIGSAKMDIVLDVTGIKEDRDAAFEVVKKKDGHIITTQPLDPSDKLTFVNLLKLGAAYAWDRTASALWRDVNYHYFIADATRGRQDLPFLREMVELGKLKPHISEVYPLQRVHEAWNKSMSMHPGGKLVLEITKEQSA
jgi:NADPH:quinone reductase-like Zn-dependent oxidoreductase